jgi:hypothetical protein
MRNILSPTLSKIVFAIILFSASSELWRAFIIRRISDTFPHGFPFQYYLAWGPCPPGEICFEFSWLFLVLDIGSWSVVSALIVQWIGDRKWAS